MFVVLMPFKTNTWQILKMPCSLEEILQEGSVLVLATEICFMDSAH